MKIRLVPFSPRRFYADPNLEDERIGNTVVQQRSIFRCCVARSVASVRPLTMNYAAIHTTGGRGRDLSEMTLVLSGEGGKGD